MILKKSVPLLLFTSLSLSGVGYAAEVSDGDKDNSKLEQLEKKLDQAMALINHLTTEIEALKEQKQALSGSTSEDVIKEIAVIERKINDTSIRIDDLEDVVVDVDERVGTRAVVKAFDAKSLDIGGFLLSTMTAADGEGGSSASFNRLVFELLVRAQLTDDFSVFVAQAFTREASPTFTDPGARLTPDFNLKAGAPTPIAWANYRMSDAFNIRLGKWVSPHGIVNVEHFPAILLDTEQPQFLRPFSGQTIFPNFQTGLQIHGKKPMGAGGSSELSYNVYVANFSGNQDDFNFGGRIGYKFGDTGFTAGINGSIGQRVEGIPSDYEMAGFDLLYDKGAILWKSEIFATNEENSANRLAYYTQPAYRINDQWTAFYRYDYLDLGPLMGDRREHVAGIVYDPIPNVRVRGTTTFRHFGAASLGFEQANVRLYQISTTLSF